MNSELLDALIYQKEKPKTLYFKKRDFSCEDNDIYIFHFLYYCIVNRVNKSEIKTNLDIRKPYDFKIFFVTEWLHYMDHFSDENLSEFELASLSKELFGELLSISEIERIFYRMTWFIQCLSIACNSSPDIRGFIQNISVECVSLTSFGNSDIAYFEVSKYDNLALDIIKTFHDEEIYFNDLSIDFFSKFKLITSQKHFDTNLKEHLLSNDITSILNKESDNTSYFARCYLFFNIVKWQVEFDSVDSSWFIKFGPFEHLKRYIKNLLWQ